MLKDTKKIPLIVLVGPTGIGKSSLAQKLALQLNTAIIHADSRQVYKEMDIGTAKPGQSMREDVPHYLLDVVAPDEDFNAGRYRDLAIPIVSRLWREEKKLPIVEGGTGLYVKALVDGLFDGPPADLKIRQRLRQSVAEHGQEYLHKQLQNIDSESAVRLHPNDTFRIIRALEVFEITGQTLSDLMRKMPPSPYQTVFLGLTADRELLYSRIEERVDKMMDDGLLEEVKGLLAKGYDEKLNSMRGLGYKQIVGHLKGEYDLAQAVYLLKRDTRRYAKRQLTWFRQDKRIHWFNVTTKNPAELFFKILPFLKVFESTKT